MIKKILQILNLFLVTLAVYGGVRFFYNLLEIRLQHYDPAFAYGEPAPVEPSDIIRQASLDYRVIVERNLFNTAQGGGRRTSEPEVDIASLEQTSLNLKLWGTVSTRDRTSGMARAVIEDRQLRHQGLYRVGDSVQHATVSEIRRKSVVLDVNGRKEKLTIEEKIPGLPFAAMEAPPESSAPAPVAERPPMSEISLKRSRIDSALENMNEIMKEVKIRPYYKDGEAAGFIVANIAPESVVRELGVKSGDIVTSVNGQAIKSSEDAMALYTNLKAGDKVSIQVMRRGRPQTIEYTIEEEMLEGN